MAALDPSIKEQIEKNIHTAKEALSRALEALENEDLEDLLTAQAEAWCASACIGRARVSLLRDLDA